MSDVELTEEQYQAIIKDVVSGLIPATATQIGAALGHLSRELGRVNKEVTAAQKDVRRLTRDYQRAFDLVLIPLTNPPEGEPVMVTVAKAMARVDPKVYALGLELDVAKSEVQRLQNDFEELQDRIRVGQTNAATVRSEHRNIGYGHGS
jgi:hypothetical protein